MNPPLITAIIVALAAGGTLGAGAMRYVQRAAPAANDANLVSDDYVSMRPEVVGLPVEDLSAEEQAGLLLMREEEKMARDVYTTLYAIWKAQTFANIAQSEQTHTEAVRDLLVKYNLTDPVTDDTVGVFVDKNLSALYLTLVERGRASLEEAFRVGAFIEDMDIADLVRLTAETDNKDIALVYSNLTRGSRNHLRAFVRQLERLGATYTPTYISVEEYESIISSGQETGTQSGGGRGWGGNSNRR
ncbi:MAG: DUF2202 domain-containing protein [Candidatus Pacebacteria bacterium]|nr:DUF2202 domain-containing protein [Candidatus Paceibacterota bacterium]